MRVFVAIDVGEAVRAEAARVIRMLSEKLETAKTPPKVTWVKLAALHVTVRFIGEVEQAEADALCERLRLPIEMPPFNVEWRGVGAFPSARHPRALWLGVIGGAGLLGALEAEVTRRIAGTVDPDVRPLLPHLTLGRIKMTGAGVDWPKILQQCDVRDAHSHVDRVTLYQSRLSQHGPHYTGLVSAPLIAKNQ